MICLYDAKKKSGLFGPLRSFMKGTINLILRRLLLDVLRYFNIAGMMTVGDKSAVMSILIHFFFNSCHPSGT